MSSAVILVPRWKMPVGLMPLITAKGLLLSMASRILPRSLCPKSIPRLMWRLGVLNRGRTESILLDAELRVEALVVVDRGLAPGVEPVFLHNAQVEPTD